ncbi:MAG: hypothetical protein RLZZ428_1159 [Pseudomonadota bacterium]
MISTLLVIILPLAQGIKVTFNSIKQLLYGLYLTNSFGYRLSKVKSPEDKKRLRIAYSKAQLDALHISIKVENPEKLPQNGQYLLVANHRSIIDPPLIEVAIENTGLFGVWISKKELYNSFFFGLFVRKAGSILLDREQSQMGGFFGDIKAAVQRGESIFIFPEGTRNKTEHPVSTFKDGSRLIALKNRLPILPLYIKTNADQVLKNALNDATLSQEVTIVIGDVIDYKEKTPLEQVYKAMFALEAEN